jgi:hypothetical protein
LRSFWRAPRPTSSPAPRSLWTAGTPSSADPHPERLARVDITLASAIAESDPELLARGVLAGLLGPVMAGPVNLVNARLVAAERSVEARIERQPETTGYKSVVSIATETSDGRKITAGTVFDGRPRIVRLRDLDIEFAPEGYVSRPLVRGPSGHGGKNRFDSRA